MTDGNGVATISPIAIACRKEPDGEVQAAEYPRGQGVQAVCGPRTSSSQYAAAFTR